ncbi:hypothetical protein TA05_05470 [Citrobacter rodentium]|nr:hypothetical protein TA05_05470 [Citrobacter rodentium]
MGKLWQKALLVIVMIWFLQESLTIHLQATIIISTKQIRIPIIAVAFGKKPELLMLLMDFHLQWVPYL